MTAPGRPRAFLFLIDLLESGGVQQDLLKIGRALLARGERCTVAAFRSQSDAMSPRYRESGMKVVFLEKRRGVDLGFLSRLRRLLREYEYDFVHALSPQTAFWTACALPAERQCVFASFLFNTHTYTRPIWRLLERLVTSQRLDAVFANSIAACRHYRSAIPSPPPIHAVHNGVEPMEGFDRAEVRRELGISEEERALVTVGRLVAVKRHEDAIEAVARVNADGRAARLFMIGDGPRRDRLESLAQSLGIEHLVVFLGERKDVRRLLPGFDAFLLPSDSEGLPNALLEAMDAGLPCVATAVGGIPEVISDGSNGLLVPPREPAQFAEAVGTLLESPDLRWRLGQAGRDTVARCFTSSRMTRRLLAHYDRMLAANQADVAFVFSQFPKVSETFLLREVVELTRRGKGGCVVSLKASQERVVHPAALRLSARVIRLPWISPGVATANLRVLLSHPLTYFGALAELSWLHRGHGIEWLKCLGVWPKIVAAAQTAKRRGVRHVHAMWATVPASCGLAMARLLRCEFSFSTHAFDIYGTRHPIADKIRKSAFVTTCTERNVHHMRGLVDAETGRRIHLVRHFADIPVPSSGSGALQDPPVILCVGSLERYKGHSVLLEAASLLRDLGVSFQLRLVGGGSEEAALRRVAEDRNLSGRVAFLGPLPQHRVSEEYRHATVFALASIRNPSGGEDNLPNVLVEAALHGVSSVVSRLGAIPEFVVDGESGLLVEPGDARALAAALERLLRDSDLRCRLTRAAQERARQMFDREGNIQVFEWLLDDVLHPGESAAPAAATMEA